MSVHGEVFVVLVWYGQPVRLPGLDKAVVTERKAPRYLLAVDHPTGRHKALWLMAHEALRGRRSLHDARRT